MKYLNNVVNAVIFLSIIVAGVSAVRTEHLFGKTENAIERALKRDEQCPYKDQEEETDYFNAAFFLDDEKDEALCDCDDADMILIGEILRDCTRQVDEKFPEFVPEGSP
jgi:hypothetical protein